MKDFIEALQILVKYCKDGDKYAPTHCEHDILSIFVDEPVSDEDVAKLEELGFHANGEYGSGDNTDFYSFRFGSC